MMGLQNAHCCLTKDGGAKIGYPRRGVVSGSGFLRVPLFLKTQHAAGFRIVCDAINYKVLEVWNGDQKEQDFKTGLVLFCEDF